jgi:hypothetical protein
MFYIVAAELCSVCLFASMVIAIGRPEVPRPLIIGLGATAAVLVTFAVVAPALPIDRVPMLETWSRVGSKISLAQFGVRLFQHAATTGGAWAAATTFGLEVPLPVMLCYMPVILVVASLPVNVAGFGAVQGAWLLLAPWAPGERILAFSVVWQLVSAIALVLRGLPFIRGVLADIREGPRTDLQSTEVPIARAAPDASGSASEGRG